MAEPEKILDQKQRILKMIQDKYPNYHPILGIAEIANDPDNDVKVLLDANKAILPYVECQLKAVEVQGNLKADFGVLRVVVMDDEEEPDGNQTPPEAEHST